MAAPRILIVKTGQTAEAVARAHGDYDQWFIGAMGEPERFQVARIFRDEPLPDPAPFDGVIVTGSPLSLCEPTPWMRTAGAVLRAWIEAGRAVLGVCFGHQLLADAWGTPVIRNPHGREIGTVTIRRTPAGMADPLFDGLAATFEVQTTHTDIASGVPEGARLLAGNAHAVVQALSFGRRGWGVQFHPELSPEAMQAIVRTRHAILRDEGLDAEGILRHVRPTPAGLQILRRFESLCG